MKFGGTAVGDLVLFAGGSFLQLFPLRGLLSPGMEDAPFLARALNYAWHMVLPTLALVIGGCAGLTMLTKNSFLEEIHKQYTITARAKGASPQSCQSAIRNVAITFEPRSRVRGRSATTSNQWPGHR